IDSSVRLIDRQIERGDAEVAKLTEELAADPIPAVRQALETAVEARIGCEKTLGGARNTVEAAATALREIEEARLAIEAKLAPLRERLGELRLKEQAASLNYEQYATQLREAGADEERLTREAQEAPRPSSLQGEITRITASIGELGAVNPAPFCLLDEVDAPLDDSNTVRFCGLVRKMSAQTQFLFISHNKITMELAEQLIGVTMPESGVSRVVAVDIDEALRIREELAA